MTDVLEREVVERCLRDGGALVSVEVRRTNGVYRGQTLVHMREVRNAACAVDVFGVAVHDCVDRLLRGGLDIDRHHVG